MKPIVAVLFLLIAVQFLQAKDIQKKVLPMPIDTFITNHYPKATRIQWGKGFNETVNALVYHIHFHNNGLLVSLEMTAEGLMLARETELSIKDAPKSFTYYIQQHKIKFIAYVEYHDDKPVYLLESTFKRESHYSIFSDKGILISTKKHFSLF